MVQQAPTPSQSPVSDELQSSLRVTDFLALLLHYRWLFLVGLLLATGSTFLIVRYKLIKYWRSESLIYVGSRFTPESRAGLAEAKVFEGSRNDMYQAVVQGQLAEELLHSTGLLRAVVQRMARGDAASSGTTAAAQPYDVARMLGIGQPDPEIREALVLQTLAKDLVDVKSLQTSGLVRITVELPDPHAARRFLQLALDELGSRLDDLNWGYFEHALRVYEQQMREDLARRDAMARELKDFNQQHGFDRLESLEQKRLAMEEQLKEQSSKLAELGNRIEALRTATSAAARLAAPGFSVINEPQLPIKKSRPQTILSTALAGVLYSFVFLCVMLLIGLLGLGRRPLRA